MDSNENFGQFDINNPKSWNKDCISHIETTLHVNEISYDGCVCLFSVRNDSTDRDIDYDEVVKYQNMAQQKLRSAFNPF